MEAYDGKAAHIQLEAVAVDVLKDSLHRDLSAPPSSSSNRWSLFTSGPVHQWSGRDYEADKPFDVISLSRSPAFTPPESDPLFDEIRRRFIDGGHVLSRLAPLAFRHRVLEGPQLQLDLFRRSCSRLSEPHHPPEIWSDSPPFTPFE